jgi:hypothetical protein
MSNNACAINDGRMLFEKCLTVPKIIPEIKVQRARNPRSGDAAIEGDRKRQHL